MGVPDNSGVTRRQLAWAARLGPGARWPAPLAWRLTARLLPSPTAAPQVLVTDQKIEAVKDIIPVLEQVRGDGLCRGE